MTKKKTQSPPMHGNTHITAFAAPIAHPPWAVVAWCDRTRLYIEFPTGHDATIVLDYPRSAAGFAEALGFLADRHLNLGHGDVFHAPPPTLPNRNGVTPAQQARAEELLKRKPFL